VALYTVPVKQKIKASEGPKTLALIKPEAAAIKIRQIDVSLDSAGAAAGVQFDIFRATFEAGGGEEKTPIKIDARDESAASKAYITYTEANKPALGFIIATYYLQPLGGLLPLPFPYGAEIIGKAKGECIGLRFTTVAGTEADVAAQIWFEE
jgi:hypothetical protein